MTPNHISPLIPSSGPPVARPLAKLGQRKQTAVLRAFGETAPLRQTERAHVGHRERPRRRPDLLRSLRQAPEHIPRHDVDTATTIVLPDHPSPAERHKLLRIEPIVHRAIGKPVRAEAFDKGLGFSEEAGTVAHSAMLSHHAAASITKIARSARRLPQRRRLEAGCRL